MANGIVHGNGDPSDELIVHHCFGVMRYAFQSAKYPNLWLCVTLDNITWAMVTFLIISIMFAYRMILLTVNSESFIITFVSTQTIPSSLVRDIKNRYYEWYILFAIPSFKSVILSITGIIL